MVREERGAWPGGARWPQGSGAEIHPVAPGEGNPSLIIALIVAFSISGKICSLQFFSLALDSNLLFQNIISLMLIQILVITRYNYKLSYPW